MAPSPGEISVLRDAARILHNVADKHENRDTRYDARQAEHAIYGLLDRCEEQ